MNTEILKLHNTWDDNQKATKRTELTQLNLDELLSSVFTAGPTYYYIVDFYDMAVSHMSASIKDIHGMEPETTTFDDILGLIHPEDIEYVRSTEVKLNEIFNDKIGREKLTKYKMCYCLRMKTANNNYKLFLHQAIVMTMDEKNGIGKSINIHTDISHITPENNYKLSLIGLMGEPSYTEIENSPPFDLIKQDSTSYSKREVEILKLISDGLTNAEIAIKLNIALDTAKNHRRNILNKANVKNTAQLIKKSLQEGLI